MNRHRIEAWEILRACVLRAFGPTCCHCGTNAQRPQVDHIFPQSIWRERALDPDNMQVLCPDCNRIKGTNAVDYRSDEHKSTPFQDALRIDFINELSLVIEAQKKLLIMQQEIDHARSRKHANPK